MEKMIIRSSVSIYINWKNNQITEEERNSYIGIYRLIHQVEQTDGAAIGALVNQGAEMTMKICSLPCGHPTRQIAWIFLWTMITERAKSRR